MVLFDNIVEHLVKQTDLSKERALAKVAPKKESVLTDVMQNPEKYFLIAYIDNNEIVARVKRRGDVQ